ncbi:uncharacterized protein B0I36DRAFT_3048 [Microdochium trichocladiopsis]|uniref:F-box domain-containing protein n=1 Tax=Microdochium trichocladiopsis TaxID=1682393 RepID=A0A9P8YGC2_9PEZI|nr:uncharacterized protein B0I36DRAFT_3048 [Microdochium trichocladiopsis]KAH7039874.1 hypothetical protein B0I36DRAFT_3048 [Microdochium trichocladiopsis]
MDDPPGQHDNTVTKPSICIPDILYIICSLLDVKDIRRFRVCCHAFAAAAAPFVHRRLVIYPHKRDLAMLKQLSLDPVVAPNVRTLVWIGHVLPRPKLDLDTFSRQFEGARAMKRMVNDLRARHGIASSAVLQPFQNGQSLVALTPTGRTPAETAALQLDDVKTMYREYTETLVEQDFMFAHDLDTAALGEAVRRFTSLREFTFSSYWEFATQGARTPFDKCLVFPGPTPSPRGTRETVAFLEALAAVRSNNPSAVKLESLTLGLLSWRFFEEEKAVLGRALETCRDLTTFRICIDTGMKEPGNLAGRDHDDDDDDLDEVNLDPLGLGHRHQPDDHDGFGTEVLECARVMSTGMLRNFLICLENLENLQVSFLYNSVNLDFPARLDDVIQPKHRWEYLTTLKLENISTERQELLAVLKRHKDTLEALSLHNIALRNTSWLVLLPQIRKTLTGLVSASMDGELFGWDERYDMEEYWNLGRDGYGAELRFDLNRYLKSQVIKTCPLSRDNNEA